MPTPVWKKRTVNHSPIVIAVLASGVVMGSITLLIDWMF